MSEPKIEQQVSDAIILSAGIASTDSVTINTASKLDAEFIYSAVDTVAVERNIFKTDSQGIHREYYLELAESDTHSIEDEDIFEWNTRPIWQVRFIPTEYCVQRMMNWTDAQTSKKAPRDFTMTPLIAKLLYKSGSHEMSAGDGETYIEFEAFGSQKLQAELQNCDIQTTNVGNMWRVDIENSKKFRQYADVAEPNIGGE